MNNSNNNILSYFIKDIKDATELAFYKQVNYYNFIQIFYKDKKLYELFNYCYNYLNNIIKHSSLKYIRKSNISYDYTNKNKALYYKNDTKILNYNPNNITYYFTYTKYLNKTSLYYFINNTYCIFLSISYYKKYKYIMNSTISTNKFTSPLILIPNKYELQYYCKFFNLYFGYIYI
jgi:hypothetical protein